MTALPHTKAAAEGPKVFTAANEWLEDQPAEARIAWA